MRVRRAIFGLLERNQLCSNDPRFAQIGTKIGTTNEAGALGFRLYPTADGSGQLARSAVLEPELDRRHDGQKLAGCTGQPQGVDGHGSATAPSRKRKASFRSLREETPSFAYTLCRCHSTVRALKNSSAPISAFV